MFTAANPSPAAQSLDAGFFDLSQSEFAYAAGSAQQLVRRRLHDAGPGLERGSPAVACRGREGAVGCTAAREDRRTQGPAHGNYRHGLYTAEMIAARSR